jgi:hypothetical protein
MGVLNRMELGAGAIYRGVKHMNKETAVLTATQISSVCSAVDRLIKIYIRIKPLV